MRVVNDRRGSTRVTVRGEALVHASHGVVRCRCLDISPSGMSLVSPRAIKPKQRVRVETSFKGHRLVFEAVIVRRTRTREGHVLGVRFEGTTPAVRDRLSEVLRSMQVQAALAMQACAIVDRLPVLQIPEPEPEPRTEKTAAVVPVMGPAKARAEAPIKGGTQELPMVGAPRSSEAPAKGGTQELPVMGPPRSSEAPAKGGTQELPMMGSEGRTQVLPGVARAEVPAKGGTQELPAMEMPRPRVATPRPDAVPPTMPRPRVATPSPSAAPSRPEGPPPRPRVATPNPGPGAPPRPRVAAASLSAAPTRARRAPVEVEVPERLDRTMITPPSQLPSARWARGERPVGLEQGWTEEELVTTHYRPSSEDSRPLSVREPPAGEPKASLVDAFEGDGVEATDAADRTEVEAAVGAFTVAEAPLPDWGAGAPMALGELVDMDAGSRSVPAVELELDLPVPPVLDQTMLGPRPPAIASLETASPATMATEADDELGPVRTGKTMVMHVKDLIAAYAPPLVEPELELDLPEETRPTTAPPIAPRLSDELQAALDRLRRRDGASKPAEAPPDGEAAPRSDDSAPRRRRVSTDAYATPGRDDTQVRALYHAALVNLGDSDRGDGS
jgi:hypothetical protein